MSRAITESSREAPFHCIIHRYPARLQHILAAFRTTWQPRHQPRRKSLGALSSSGRIRLSLAVSHLAVDVVVRAPPVMRVLHVVAVGAVVVLVVVFVPGVIAGFMAVAVLVAMGVRVFVDMDMLVGVGGAVGMGVLMHVGVFVFVLMLVGRAFVVAVGMAVDTCFVLRETTAVLAHGALLYRLLIVCLLQLASSALDLAIEYSQNIEIQGA